MHLKPLTLAAVLAAAPIAALADGHADNRAFVIEALTETLINGNADAVTEYFAPDFLNHNPMAADGAAAMQGMIGALAERGGIDAEIVRVIADGDLVALHMRYEGLGPVPLVAFDVFRVEDGLIVEHWDNLIPEAAPNPSGRTQLDGATEITDLDQTEANRALVIDFITRSLLNHEEVNITDYISPETYLQHNPMVADGLEGFGAFMGEMAAQGITMDYTEIHQTVAEGNFVLSLSEGSFGGEPTAFYDLFRLEDGLIVEHWDVIAPMPGADAPNNSSGKF